jgi:hypothetical protein
MALAHGRRPGVAVAAAAPPLGLTAGLPVASACAATADAEEPAAVRRCQDGARPAAAADSGAAGDPGRPAGGARAAAAGAQFVIVSHKPQVFERARCLLGVYAAARGGTEAVAAHCF